MGSKGVLPVDGNSDLHRDGGQRRPVDNGGVSSEQDHHDDVECAYQVGYRLSYLKLALLLPLALLPLPLGLLLAYWFRHIALRLVAWRSPLHKAHYVIVKDVDGKYRVERVRHLSLPVSGASGRDSEEEDEQTPMLSPAQERRLAYFKHRHIIYLYSEDKRRFVRLLQWERGRSFDTLHEQSTGLSSEEHRTRLTVNGLNEINVPVKPLYALFVDEVLHPFYVFELVTVAFWMADAYYYYSGCILLIQAISITISMVQTRREERHLHNMVIHSSQVTVLRQGVEECSVSSTSLVPGDVLVIPPGGMVCPCDAVLLSGSAIVNESMLTGESVPVTKTALPRGEELYDITQHKKHTLFGGTDVIQTRYYRSQRVLAVVVSTSFWTAKGTLVRSILFPKPLDVKLWKDSIKFVLALAVIAFAGVIYSLTINLVNGYNIKETIFRSLDVVTILVPPALPAALTVGTVYSIARLKRKKIHCISPQRINLCGQVDVVCFDKTGTLTEDSLDLLGVKPCDNVGSHLFTNGCSIQDQSAIFSSTVVAPGNQLSRDSPLLHGMACCHSLTLIGGEVKGDPLDYRMFQATGWVLEEPGEESSNYDILVPALVHPPADGPQPGVELAIMKQFTFSSDLQRMSVLVRRLPSGEYPEPGASPHRTEVFVKGAPETIQRLCVRGSVPDEFGAVLQGLTRQGYRVLALAHKVMDLPWHRMDRIDRSSVEDGLTLLGLLVLQNCLKPQTAPVIRELGQCAIRTVMVTGDNILTAICVARECGMVLSDDDMAQLEVTVEDSSGGTRVVYHSVGDAPADLECSIQSHITNSAKRELLAATTFNSVNGSTSVAMEPTVHLAVDGRSFDAVLQHCPELLPRLLVKGTVFARMSPPQKQQLVERLQGVGYNVAMCGDGANDCGALKAAMVGISLSEAEASIAAPFTSAQQDVRCVPTVIKEGRASLVTSFSLFKFMALYCIAEFVTASVLYSIESNLGDFQYLFVDLILALALAFGMGYSGPALSLVKERPPSTLVGPFVISQLLVHTALIVLFQLLVWFYLHTTLWFQPLVPGEDSDNIWCYENAVMFLYSNFQYLALALVLSSGPPYRQPTYCNLYLMVATLILLPLCVFLVLAPLEWMLMQPLILLQIQQTPSWKFKAALLEIALVNFLLAYIVQVYLLDTMWYRRLLARLWQWRRRDKGQSEHRRIAKALEMDGSWPPLVDALD